MHQKVPFLCLNHLRVSEHQPRPLLLSTAPHNDSSFLNILNGLVLLPCFVFSNDLMFSSLLTSVPDYHSILVTWVCVTSPLFFVSPVAPFIISLILASLKGIQGSPALNQVLSLSPQGQQWADYCWISCLERGGYFQFFPGLNIPTNCMIE